MHSNKWLGIITAALLFLPEVANSNLLEKIRTPAFWHELYHERIPAQKKPASHSQTADQSEHGSVDLAVYIPKSAAIHGIVVILPGWNHPNTRLLQRTKIKQLADDYGYLLLAPNMGKTLYAARYYPQTRIKWHEIPGRRYMQRILLPYLQNKYFKLSDNIYGLGISTGARGMALAAIDHPYLFRAVALLSGDFDPKKMPNDNLMRALYGAYNQFPERRKKDNPLLEAPRLRSAVYLAHGTRDPVVPFEQSKLFFDKLARLGRVQTLRFSQPQSGHSYNYWGSELPAIFSFFAKQQR